jgi:myo-inositol-1(or 4)-monophosphatase
MASPSKETRVAIKAAKDAGAILRARFHKQFQVRMKAGNSPVSSVALASNALIIRRLAKAFPEDHILSEESDRSPVDDLRNAPTWVIDPLDGTTNYVNGIPLCMVVIARVVNAAPVLSVLYDPLHDELFWAEKGKGAYLNGKKIRVGKRSVAAGALFLAGRGYRNRDREEHRQVVYALEARMPYFRRLGSAAIMLSSVACGRADAVILTGDKPWDTAAGVLLVKEAGGRVTTYEGRPWTITRDDMIASNPVIHGSIVKTIREVQGRKV